MFKILIITTIIALTYAAPGLDYSHHDSGYGVQQSQLIAIKPVRHVTVANAWNPWQQNNGWNPWQQNNGWNPWQQSNGWNPWQQNNGWQNQWKRNNAWNPWQQNNGWNLWNQGYGHGSHQAHIVKVPVHQQPTSFSQVTSYHMHPVPVIKTIVPTYAHDYGYGHDYHH